jgi:hypothetical protein
VHLSRTATDLGLPLQALVAFAQGGPLPGAALHLLVKKFYPYNVAFDATADRLLDTSPPDPYVPPDPAVAKALNDYRAALAAAQPKEPARPKLPGPLALSRPARPGFEVK